MLRLSNNEKIILVAVLDWGLGHATRCIPVIQQLLKKNYSVIIAGNGNSLALLKAEFPNIKTHEVIGYNIKYPFDNMILNMSFQWPRILWVIWKEYRQVKKLQKKYHLSGIISDNRYGCFSRSIPSVFIGHQLQILIPIKILSKTINFFHQKWLSFFDEVWIPDTPNGLSGKLSKTSIKNTSHIGLLSRMKYLDRPFEYKVVVVLSGVEPQRTKLENILILQLKQLGLSTLIIQGKVGDNVPIQLTSNIKVIPYLTSEDLNEVMAKGEIIICRPGYSSLMDLAQLQKKSIVIPTPGQTEQEYLGHYLQEKNQVVCQLQSQIDLTKALDKIQASQGLKCFNNQENLLKKAIDTTF